jgi:hypothetical protein
MKGRSRLIYDILNNFLENVIVHCMPRAEMTMYHVVYVMSTTTHLVTVVLVSWVIPEPSDQGYGASFVHCTSCLFHHHINTAAVNVI